MLTPDSIPNDCPLPLALPTGTEHELGVPTSPRRLDRAITATATRLVPLVTLLQAIQPQVAQESVFHTRRLKIQAHMTIAFAELKAERPRRRVLTHSFQTITDLVREETRDISKDELKQATKELVLATLKNAPKLISIAHQARLLS
ncbi:hypothetical protein MUN82_13225 [Hymenobacter aerilatus]|uniref:Uncharacterized protein n=1 Tax=Hymenobacter aerilatus TaxID=2932251 RepID=A0A8T9SQB0_9BACT|nr:hypothetical protein [Hymenobacter aerilatus]UOR03907.1 hypothetical protein MUN82_13225 [Hymenobacter aerilatus]